MLAGRHVARCRLVGAWALEIEVSGHRARLRLDAGRGTSGLYLLECDEPRDAGEGEDAATGRARHAFLLFKKHLCGARVAGMARVPGERTVVLDAGRAVVVLRGSGPAPALTLAAGGAAVATIGAGAPAWPVPVAAPEREWDRIDALGFAEAVTVAATDRSLPRAILAVCPSLGPLLARELDGSAASLEALRVRLALPRPSVHAPAPIEACHDADLSPVNAVALAPIPLDGYGIAFHPPSWREAASLFLRLRLRGERFDLRRRRLLDGARREVRRLAQLEDNLGRDLDGLADPRGLRRQAEALLALPGALGPGAEEADVPDPYAPEVRLRFAIDPSLTAPANADRFFRKARRLEQGREEVTRRLATSPSSRGRLRQTPRASAHAQPSVRATTSPPGAFRCSSGAVPGRTTASPSRSRVRKTSGSTPATSRAPT